MANLYDTVFIAIAISEYYDSYRLQSHLLNSSIKFTNVMTSRPTLEEANKISNGVQGWLTDDEGSILYNLAKRCSGKGVMVEIGSWMGKSTIFIAYGLKASRSNTKFYAIDPHAGDNKLIKSTFHSFQENIIKADINDIVTPLVMLSKDAASTVEEPIEFIFIDGSHIYEDVKLDFDTWFPKVIEGGKMAFHDTLCFPGPEKVVDNLIYKSRFFKNIKFIDSLTVAEKVKYNTITDRIMNRYILCIKKICKFGATLKIPRNLKTLGKKIARAMQC